MSNIIPKKKKRKNRYTILLVSDSGNKAPKEIHALPLLAIGTICAFALVVIIGLCVITLQQKLITDKDNTIDSLNSDIVALNNQETKLTNQNNELSVTISSLNKTIQDMKVQKDQIESEYRELSQEVYELCSPTGCPVTGTATVPEKQSKPDKNGLVLFETYKDANIIAAANGTVLEVNNLINDEHDYKYEIVIDHGNNFKTYYYSDEIPLVIVDQEVDKTQPLFRITKDSTTFGYKIQEGEKFINPWTMIEIFG